MGVRFISRAIFSLLLLSSVGVSAQSSPTEVLIHDTIQLRFVPASAEFFVDTHDGNVFRYPAYFVPISRAEVLQNEKHKWLAGIPINLHPRVSQISYQLVVKGDAGEIGASQPRTVDELGTLSKLGTVRVLRERILEERERLISSEARRDELNSHYRRVRSDAEIIGGLGRVAAVKKEVEVLEEQIAFLDKSIERQKEFLERVSGEAQPENFERRQRELTAQVAELASLARGAESAEAERRKDSVLQLARQKALVRETKGINLEQLSREVDELRNRRLALEKELGFKEGESEEYELY